MNSSNKSNNPNNESNYNKTSSASAASSSSSKNNNNNDNDNDNNRNQGTQQQHQKNNIPSLSQQPSTELNPYSFLNISKTCTIEEIQKSYKLLSRIFHPDKQPVQNRERAQEYFVQLKSAYDVLMDPTLKFILDHFGYESGVKFIKCQGKLYQKIELLLQQRRDELEQQLFMGNAYSSSTEDEKKDDTYSSFVNLPSNHELEQQAIGLFSEAVQQYNYQIATNMNSNKPIITGSIKVNCNTTHSAFLEEGIEPLSIDVDETKVAFTISQSQKQLEQASSKVGSKHIKYSCSASSTLKSSTGEGMTSGQLSMEYEPVQGTEIHANLSAEIDMTPPPLPLLKLVDHQNTLTKETKSKRQTGHRQRQQQQHHGLLQPKLEIGSSRIFTNRTYVHANLSAPLNSFIQPLCNPTNHFLSSREMFLSSSSKGGDNDDDGDGDENGAPTPSDFLLSLTTQRSLFQDKIRCIWIAGLALPDLKLQYGMISITTNNFQSGNGNDEDRDDEGNDGNEEHERGNKDDNDDEHQQQYNKKDNQGNENVQKDEHETKQQRSKQKRWFIKPPKYTLKLNLGMSHTPISLTTEQAISETHSGTISVGYGTVGWDLKLLSTRAISKLCNLSVGVRHIGAIGFSTLFKIERGSMNFSVPVLVTTAMSPSVAMKSMYVTMLMGLVDAFIGDLINDSNYLRIEQSNNAAMMSTKSSLEKSKEEYLIEKEKIKRERLKQIELMSKTAESKTQKEEMKNDGLVILLATYEVQNGDSIDVTIPLQFWVMNSALHLPPMSKGNMLGFYDVRRGLLNQLEGPDKNGSFRYWLSHIWNLLNIFQRDDPFPLQQNKALEIAPIPTLAVRYRYCDSVYEIKILDDEELNLPSPDAMKLGGSHVI